MGKRYYCDYCDKTFPYNTTNRKKHVEGSQHQTLRNAYYSGFKDAKTLILEEVNKKPCFKYLITSNCAYGDLCRCSHKSLDELNQLVKQYEAETSTSNSSADTARVSKKKMKRDKKREEQQSADTTNHQAIIDNSQTSENNNRNEKTQELCEKLIPKYKIPSELKKYSYLPPSLQPLTINDFLNCKINTWE